MKGIQSFEKSWKTSKHVLCE